MGDHRVSLKVQFEMHGHKASVDQWVNWTEDYSERIKVWLDEQIEIARGIYFDAEFDAEMLQKAAKENEEREELARLKAKYESGGS